MKRTIQYTIMAALVFVIALIGGMMVGQGSRQPSTMTPESSVEVTPTPEVGAQPETPVIAFSSIAFESTHLSVEMGETLSLVAQTQPSNADDSLYWYTMDDEVAYIEEGVLTPLKVGTVTVVAQSNLNPSLEASFTVEILPSETFIQVESIEVVYDFDRTLNHGESSTIQVNVYPENATLSDLNFSTPNVDMLDLESTGQVSAKGGVGYAYVIITSKSNPSIYEKVKFEIFPLSHENANTLTYTAGDISTLANTEWGWFQVTGASIHDLEPLNYAARYTESVNMSADYDKLIFGNAHDYPEMCMGGNEESCIGIDAFIQMFRFDDDSNEAMYRVLAEFAPNSLDEMHKVFDQKGFEGGSYYFEGRWFHVGYMDYGLKMFVSGKE